MVKGNQICLCALNFHYTKIHLEVGQDPSSFSGFRPIMLTAYTGEGTTLNRQVNVFMTTCCSDVGCLSCVGSVDHDITVGCGYTCTRGCKETQGKGHVTDRGSQVSTTAQPRN